MATFTNRERFLRTMRYQPVDRIPLYEFPLWGQTMDRWYSEGMPLVERDDGLLGPMGLVSGSEFFGLDRREYVDILLDAQPPFPMTVLEETDSYRTFVDEEGSIRMALKRGEAHNTRASMDTFIRFPVKTRKDWEEFKWRFDPHTPLRYPKWWAEKVKLWSERDYVLVLPRNSARAFGLYSWLRRCLGTENACTVFYDDPDFTEELLDFYTDFTIETVHKAVDNVQFDYFNIFEDMAGKGGPLVSPALLKKFMLPRYKRITSFLKSHSVAFVTMDSDGDLRPLIPLLIEGGIDCLWPIEVAAGMDPLDLRRKYGRDLRMWGGIDKRELAKGRKEIEKELFSKVPALIEEGGYIPTLDHDVPPDVPYDNFMYYLDLKRRIIEGRYGA